MAIAAASRAPFQTANQESNHDESISATANQGGKGGEPRRWGPLCRTRHVQIGCRRRLGIDGVRQPDRVPQPQPPPLVNKTETNE